MTLTETISLIAIQTTANVISNLAWFILIIWGVRKIVKDVPKWIEDYNKIRTKQRAVDNALRMRT